MEKFFILAVLVQLEKVHSDLAALCYALEEFNRLKCTRKFDTCTSRLLGTNHGKENSISRLFDIDLLKKIYGRIKKKNPKPLTDPR